MRNTNPVDNEALPAPVTALDRIKGWPVSHPISLVVLIASLARAGAILVTTLLPRGTFALDDNTYIGLARAMATGDLSGWGAYEHQLSEQTLTFLWPLKSIFQLLGTHVILGQVYVSLWGIAAAALTTLIAIRFLPRGAAILAGLVVALLPSEVLWSSLVLKDAAVWAVLALLAILALLANRAHPQRLAIIAAALVVTLFGLAYLRQHTLVVACWSLPVALWFGRSSLRPVRVIGGVLFALLIPIAAGLGVGGWRIATDPNLAERRIANASGAESAFVDPGEDVTPGEDGGPGTTVGGEGGPEGTPGGSQTPGEEETPGETGAPPPPATPDDSVSANITHLPRGLTVMLFEPVPWRQSSSSNVTLARWEMLLWYPLLILAVVGARFAGRYLSELAFPLLVGFGMLLVYALAEGNIGTAYRHRGEFVWVVALLAALGAKELVGIYRWDAKPRHESSGVTLEPDTMDGTNREKGSDTWQQP